MTNITEEKQRLFNQYAKKWCKLKDPSKCTKDLCTCNLAAELRAFINMTIPPGFQDFTIKDFDGKLKNGFNLHPSVAALAKQNLFKYCWGKSNLLDRLSITPDTDLDNASIIAERLKRGHNIVIHGDSVRKISDSFDGKTKVVKMLPLGRTFIASVATREVIKLRVNPKYPAYSAANYEWIEFNALFDVISSRNKVSSYGSDESFRLEICDWLVVDNITEQLLGASSAQKSFMTSFIDPFLYSRIKNKIPTVLVFRFDVDKRRLEIDNAFGISMGKIIDNKNTCVISLTQPDQFNKGEK